jgi:hypothetical protein
MSESVKRLPTQEVTQCLHVMRDQRIILDADLAFLYGVTTKRLNEQYRRNRDRFPEDFAFRLTPEEWVALRSQTPASEQASNLRSQNATSSAHGGRRYLPVAFTEHGALMAANILNSPRAVAMSVYVVRAFVRLRQDLAANAAILKRLAEIDRTLLIHDSALRDIYQRLRPLLAPPPPPPKPEIGFHVKEDSVPYRVKRRNAEGRDVRQKG